MSKDALPSYRHLALPHINEMKIHYNVDNYVDMDWTSVYVGCILFCRPFHSRGLRCPIVPTFPPPPPSDAPINATTLDEPDTPATLCSIAVVSLVVNNDPMCQEQLMHSLDLSSVQSY
jgi:hypothetical protein